MWLFKKNKSIRKYSIPALIQINTLYLFSMGTDKKHISKLIFLMFFPVVKELAFCF